MTTSRIDALRRLLDSDPNDATTHYMLGHEYFKAQKHADAVGALRRYLQLADDEGAVYRLLARSLEHLGDFEGARHAYRDGLEAARRHSHQPMIDEYTQALHDLT
jgi:Flp pilus assembly protein TadD